jgi:hypothetical protein
MSKPNSVTAGRFAAFYAFCADHQAECSHLVRVVLVGSAIILALVAFLLRTLIAHPLPAMSADLVGNAAYGGFDAMVMPTTADVADQPPVDATAVLNGMLLAITFVTGGAACLAFLIDCFVRAGAIAHRLSTARKLPEAEGGD